MGHLAAEYRIMNAEEKPARALASTFDIACSIFDIQSHPMRGLPTGLATKTQSHELETYQNLGVFVASWQKSVIL